MDLATFGAILSFAIDLEAKAAQFYQDASPLHDHFEGLASASTKNSKLLERIRRENVAEMILEPISDFDSEDYTPGLALASDASPAEVVAQAAEIEAAFQRYYQTAAEKLPIKEVSRRLGKLARQHEQSQDELKTLAVE